MSKKFKSGDLVVLKSGGPVMTVKDVDGMNDEGVNCQWFSGKKLEYGEFAADSLVIAPNEQ